MTMDKKGFWSLIAAAKTEADGDDEEQIKILVERLSKLSPSDIVEFDKIYDECRHQAYDWTLWGAAYTINGGCSDDGFEYFLAWLIAQGEEVYNQATRDPDSLVEVVDQERDDYELEEMLGVARHAYTAKTGKEMPERPRSFPSEPTGKKWKEDDLPKLLPRLSERYGE